jgi:hypothetical protein
MIAALLLVAAAWMFNERNSAAVGDIYRDTVSTTTPPVRDTVTPPPR